VSSVGKLRLSASRTFLTHNGADVTGCCSLFAVVQSVQL